MPKVTVGQTIEIHYQSPSEMVGHLSSAMEGGVLILQTTMTLEEGARRDVVVRVPWLNREIRVPARVLRVARAGEAPGLRLRLLEDLDGGRGLEELREVVGKVRSGAILEESGTEGSLEQRLRQMAPTLRAMLASKANPEERLILARDPDPRVIDFLLKNPSFTVDEVRRLVSKLTINQRHFEIILRNPVWMGDETLRTAMARNPRLPEFMAETVLGSMATPMLKSLVQSSNTTASTRRVASRILQMRGVALVTRQRGG
jgi:hypothetical protein